MCLCVDMLDLQTRRGKERERWGGGRFQENVQLYSKVEWEAYGLKSWRIFVSKSQLKVIVQLNMINVLDVCL